MRYLIVSGSRVVTPAATGAYDIGIQDGAIASISSPGTLALGARRVIDAGDRMVRPGGVEVHAHIAEPLYTGWTRGEEVWLQSPEGATRAAIVGGTTTVLSFAFIDVHTRQRSFDAGEAVAARRAVFAGRFVTRTLSPRVRQRPSM